MHGYPKINSVFKRDEKTKKFIIGDWATPEIEYLKDNIWVFTEKIDGTNVRVIWDGQTVTFKGKEEESQMPTFLFAKLQQMFPKELFQSLYPTMPLTLYGEGYGARIQSLGVKYIPKDVSFILFDVLIDTWWLQRPNIEDVASKLNLQVVPIIAEGTIEKAINLAKDAYQSTFGAFPAEGLVLKPKLDLCNRSGHRIITKVKHKDFKEGK